MSAARVDDASGCVGLRFEAELTLVELPCARDVFGRDVRVDGASCSTAALLEVGVWIGTSRGFTPDEAAHTRSREFISLSMTQNPAFWRFS